MMTSLDDLRSTFERVSDAIKRNMAASEASVTGKISLFWRDVIADRKNFPDLNEIMVFRRDNFADGIGDPRQGAVDEERFYAEQIYQIFRRMVDAEFVGSIPESTFGAPLAFPHDGIVRSASFWINAATTKRVIEFVAQHGKRGPLRVLEIGAGWGACAYQIHSTMDVASYTIVDLPHNLHISSIHLASVLPERRLELLDVSGPVLSTIENGTITGCLPGTIPRLKAKFDLVLNSFSLQEMELDTVKAYMDWIASVLADDGIFISLNSHAKAGVRRPSDYGYANFHIHHWNTFRPSPSGFLNTIPYEVVLGPRKVDSPVYPEEVQDGLGWLMQLGLDRDLDGYCERLVAGSLDTNDRYVLAEYGRLFAVKTEAERREIAAKLETFDRTAVWPYVIANIALTKNDPGSCSKFLDEACQRRLSGFARVRANVLLAAFARAGTGPSIATLPDGFDPTRAYPEAAQIVRTRDVSLMLNQTRRVFGCS
jgi:hypothetical protein